LIFAQFSSSLDVVEEYLLEPHMPSVRYLRLDGRVPPQQRSAIVDTFCTDDSVRVLLLTTKIGGLGLNLTAADTVVFLEHDWNPHVDLQAMDRVHRMGQTRMVNVFRLITTDSIEEKVMNMQKKKLLVSDAIVTSENSTMYSMGTDKLLDIFTCRSNSNSNSNGNADQPLRDMNDLLDETSEEYAGLSVESFLRDIGQQQQEQEGCGG